MDTIPEKPCGWSAYPPELASQLTDYQIEIATAVAGSEKKLRKRSLYETGCVYTSEISAFFIFN